VWVGVLKGRNLLDGFTVHLIKQDYLDYPQPGFTFHRLLEGRRIKGCNGRFRDPFGGVRAFTAIRCRAGVIDCQSGSCGKEIEGEVKEPLFCTAKKLSTTDVILGG